MPSRIDHVIAAARDLASLESAFTRLGFSVVGGGIHPHLGTRNRIVVLGDGYVELLGIADADKASSVLVRRLTTTPTGWVGFAVQSEDIESEAEAMRSRGLDTRGPRAGQLVAPGGKSRSWRVATTGDDDLWATAEPLPFLIQHDANGDQHRRQLACEDQLTPHTNGAAAFHAVHVAIHDLDAAAASFAHAYGLQASDPVQYDTFLVAETRELPLLASGERIVLVHPTGDGPARHRLESAGEGVCAITVAVANIAATEAFLRGQVIGFNRSGGTIWLAEHDTLGISLAFADEQ